METTKFIPCTNMFSFPASHIFHRYLLRIWKIIECSQPSVSTDCLPGDVEAERLEEEREADPLVVGDVSSLVLLVVGAGHHPGVGHVPPNVQGEGPGDGVGGVDPTVEIEHIVWNVLKLDQVIISLSVKIILG